jgi:hypothetical protein
MLRNATIGSPGPQIVLFVEPIDGAPTVKLVQPSLGAGD